MTADNRRDATRRTILTAAAAVFRERGYDGASIDDIIARAGVARGTLYYNFKSKEAIALSLAAAATAALDGRIRPRIGDPEEDPDALLLEAMLASCQWFVENAAIARVVLTAPLRHPELAAAPSPDRPSFRRLTGDILTEGQRRGLFRTDIDAAALTQIIGGVFIQAVLVGLDKPTKSVEGWVTSLVRVLMDGLRHRDVLS
ncbi:TetR/AcrR family transcriptional regulator [Novispirillum sp. DQ9]|uniref:TetR/AcrR family transcriptional regulator n=1 Tax=Novispirillum sp. DQ9 TaxID=3398612 RepID=UPI003C7D1638